jgi:hypothetical protein
MIGYDSNDKLLKGAMVMNTRKDYWRAVRIIREANLEQRPVIATCFIAFFSKDNPRFDAQRFTDAVNASEEL